MLDNSTTVSIVQSPRANAPATPNRDFRSRAPAAKVAAMVSAAKHQTIPAHKRVSLMVLGRREGPAVFQLYANLYSRYSVIRISGEVELQLGPLFFVLIANFVDERRHIRKCQVIAQVLPHPTKMFDTHIPFKALLGIDEVKGTNTRLLYFHAPHPLETLEAKGTPPVDQVSLQHLSEDEERQVRELQRKYDKMWDGSPGEINTVKNNIYLTPGAHSFTRRPYRAEPLARKEINKEVQNMTEKTVVEPAQFKWASPVDLAPKPDGS